ncbi:MAG: gliding motility-associated C-terminal domain-containing protein, partial [Bacteroidetes bacterium]|nr:gliding motility-associated C-terminal domain-containing protein [Bacteroidota bacterium]
TDLGCPGPSSNAIVFTVNPIPVVSLTSSDTMVCLNNNISFTASPAGYDNYDFYDGVTLVQSGPDSIYITDSLQFVNSITVVATNLGCTSLPSNSVSVTLLSLPTAIFDWSCAPDPFITQFSAFNSIAGVGTIVSWNWDFGDGAASTGLYSSHAYSDTGEFTVSLTVTTDNGCSGSATDTVQAPPTAEFALAPTVTVLSNPLIIFTDASSNDVISWQWDFGDPDSDSNSSTIQNPMHIYGSEQGDTGVYYILLTVENANGCRDTITHSVWIQGEYFIFTPNAFTPDNKDGDNDVFIPKGIGIENDFQMFIYDRWGNLIYETNDINKPWDGRANGGREIAPQDVYVWVVHVRDNLRKKHRYIGHVTLIR